MKKILFRSLVCALISSAAICSVALARGNTSLVAASTNHDVGMSFYKLIGRQPDFESWIKTDPRYVKSPAGDQPNILKAETQKMEMKFNALEVRKTPIVVRTAVAVVIKNVGENKKFLDVNFPGLGTVYFPYLLSDQNITVIPNGIDLYRHIPLTDLEAANVGSRIDYKGIATMVVEIIPTSADGRAPIMLDATPQWLMLGEIGFIGFYNNYLEEIWSSQAPGYVRKDAEKIFNLHQSAQKDGGTSLDSLKP